MAVTRAVGRTQRQTSRDIRRALEDYESKKFWSYAHDNTRSQELADARAKAALRIAYDNIVQLAKQERLLP